MIPRLLTYALLLLSLTACGPSDEEKEKADQEIGNVAEFVEPNPDLRKWSGTSDKVVDTETTFKKGYLALNVKHAGSAHFSIWLVDPAGKQTDLLVNTIGTYEGTVTTEISEDGKYAFKVSADGEWTFETTTLKNAQIMPTSLEGTGDLLSVIFYLEKDASFKIKGHYEGESNFIVHLVSAQSGSTKGFLFNKIGAYDGETLTSVSEAGFYFFSVKSSGTWKLEVSE